MPRIMRRSLPQIAGEMMRTAALVGTRIPVSPMSSGRRQRRHQSRLPSSSHSHGWWLPNRTGAAPKLVRAARRPACDLLDICGGRLLRVEASSGLGPEPRQPISAYKLNRHARMIVTEAGVHPTFRRLSMWLRERQMLARLHGLAKEFPTPPASSGIIFDGDEGRLARRLSCEISPVTCPKRGQERSTPSSGHSIGSSSPAKPRRGETHERENDRGKGQPRSLISQPDTIANLILEAAGQK